MSEPICECPKCGRLHRYLANNPPEAISGDYPKLQAELDRLRADVERLREALEKLADYDVIGGVIYAHKEPEFIARLKQARAILASTLPSPETEDE